MLRERFDSAAIRDEQSARLCRYIVNCDIYKSARVIGAYMPLPREADITPVLQHALAHGKGLALPLCGPKSDMTFRRVERLDLLRRNAWGIPEPGEDAAIVAMQDIDLLLVPLEGIDPAGYRLGKGGGYYDRVLYGQSVMTLGCALTWQWVEEVPREMHDMPLCGCADANGIHMFGTTDRKEVYSNGQEAED